MSLDRPPKGRCRGNWVPWVAIGLTWMVTGAVAVLGARSLGARVREQIVRRDGAVLLAMARAQASLPMDDPDALLAGEPFAMFVSIGRFEGIVAARMFDSNGVFLASVPDHVRERAVGDSEMAEVRAGRPVSRFRPAMTVDELFHESEPETVTAGARAFPAVDVLVPLPGPGGQGLAGVAEFILEGASVQQEFERLDHRLWRDVGVVLVLALGATGAVLGWAFGQVERSRRLLSSRTEDLLRANRDLARSARVAALGAVTAHLVHGLRNPVSGLHSFVSAGPEAGGGDNGAWEEAMEATRRMQATIGQVVRVLRDHESGLDYDARLEEVAEAVLARVRPAAEARGVSLEKVCVGTAVVDSRSAGLLALLLTNLVENGLDATQAGGQVRLRLEAAGDRLVAEVSDDGKGLDPSVRERLFQPQRSTKEGGSGLGLAITRQLALALGGGISLVATGPAGTVFRVEAPLRQPGHEAIAGA